MAEPRDTPFLRDLPRLALLTLLGLLVLMPYIWMVAASLKPLDEIFRDSLSLLPERFVYFVEQDRLYLRAYSRALSYVAGHAENTDDTALFTGSASKAVSVEAGMHRELLEGFGVGSPDGADEVVEADGVGEGNGLGHTSTVG